MDLLLLEVLSLFNPIIRYLYSCSYQSAGSSESSQYLSVQRDPIVLLSSSSCLKLSSGLLPYRYYRPALAFFCYMRPSRQKTSPQTNSSSNYPFWVKSSVQRTPMPLRLPPSNCPSQTQFLRIYLPWQCFNPSLNWPMYLAVLERRTPLPCILLFSHSPTYLTPQLSLSSQVSTPSKRCLSSSGKGGYSQSGRPSLWQKARSSSSSLGRTLVWTGSEMEMTQGSGGKLILEKTSSTMGLGDSYSLRMRVL